VRDLLYKLLALSNDVRAVRRGRVGRRIAGRVTGRAMGRVFR